MIRTALIFLIFVLLNQNTNAQAEVIKDKTIDDRNYTHTKDYEFIARDKIVLGSGFLIDGQAGNSLDAYIDESLVFDADYLEGSAIPDAADRSLTKSLAVGTIPGAFNVGANGAAVYTIPIDVPAGTGGITPSLSLSYNSSAGNGMLGKCWVLNGLSSISRTSKNIYTDGITDGIDLSADDRFALDGQRLILKSGTYGTANSVYGTQKESFMQITAKSISGIGSPAYFIVKTKNGRTIEYGRTSDSRVMDQNGSGKVIAWKINKVSDPKGNYMTYTYKTIEGQPVLSRIDYTANDNASLSSYYSVEFFYETREDKRSSIFVKNTFNSNVLANKIKVKYKGSLLREYKLTYKKDIYSQLVQVDLYNNRKEKINETVFNWGQNSSAISINQVSVPSDDYSVYFKDRKWVSGDVNGDGRTDLISHFNYSSGSSTVGRTKVHLNTTSAEGNITFSPQSDYWASNLNVENEKNLNRFHFCSVININGDGIPDPIMPSILTGGVPSEIRFRNIRYSDELKWVTHNISSNTEELPAYTYSDLNGDGMHDIIFIENKRPNAETDFEGKIFYGNTDFPNGSWYDFNISLPADERIKYIFCNDYNSDGLNDVLVVSNKRIKIFRNNGTSRNSNDVLICSFTEVLNSVMHFNSKHNTIKEGDFNGDGLVDFLINLPHSTNWDFILNDGNFSFYRKHLSSITAANDPDDDEKDDNQDGCIITDLNNDGLSDLIISDAKYKWEGDITGTWKVFDYQVTYWYLSTGDNVTLIDQKTTYNSDYAPAYFRVGGDFNGDGRIDLINLGEDIKDNSSGVSWRNYTNYNSNFDQGLITAISDGHNNLTQIEYRPLTHTDIPGTEDFYTKGNSAVYPATDFQAPLYCVWKNNQPDGIGGTSTTEYLYSEAVLQAQGAGFLGFKSSIARNNTSGRVSLTSITDFSPSTWGPLQSTQQVKFPDGTLISSAVTTYQHETLNEANKPLQFFSYAVTSEETNHLTGLSVTSTVDYNGNKQGNIHIVTKDYGDGYTEETRFENYINVASHLPNTPKDVFHSLKHPDDTEEFILQTSFTYNTSLGHLLSKIENANLPGKEVSTLYSNYDLLGNPGSTTVSAASEGGNISQTTAFEYDPTGRFVLSQTDAMGIETKNDYDFSNGTLLATTIDNGSVSNTTTYSYDSWGKPTKITYADGNTARVIVDWNVDNYPNAAYRKYQTISGGAPVTTYYDAFGRILKESSPGFNDLVSSKVYTYNGKGNLTRKEWSGIRNGYVEYTYFASNRIKSETYHTGKNTTYSYSNNTVTITEDGKTYKKSYDNWGNLAWSYELEPANRINYTYNSQGNPVEVTAPNSTITMEYDDLGYQTSLSDPDALEPYTYRYDALGRLTYQQDPNQVTSRIYYDSHGRRSSEVSEKTVDNNTVSETYDYEYYETGINLGLLKKVIAPNGSYEEYQYDALGRKISTTMKIESGLESLSFDYQYDQYGNTSQVTYPENFIVENTFDQYGNLIRVTANQSKVWELVESNATAQETVLGNNLLTTTKSFNTYGDLTGINTQNTNGSALQAHLYTFNPVSKMLEQRSDDRTGYNLSEAFGYDELYRLTNWEISQNNTVSFTNSIEYDQDLITNKSQVGDYKYDPLSAHRVDEVTAVDGNPYFQEQSIIKYTSFNKVSEIVQSNLIYNIHYGPAQQRIKSVFTDSDEGESISHYYYGLFEKEVSTSGEEKSLYYIPGGDGVIGVYIKTKDGAENLYYLLKDHLGSVVALVNETGEIEQESNYDPWGRYRNPQNWELADAPQTSLINRGFTFHEHLDRFNLINMNGRVYDPVLGMFTSLDNFVQSPNSLQNFNRYTYGLNNPLFYTDPSGESFLEWMTLGTFGAASLYNSHSHDMLKWVRIDALSGGVMSSTLSSTILATAAGYTLSPNSEFGYRMQEYISPIALKIDVHRSSEQSGIGFSLSTGDPQISPFGYRWHYGATHYNNYYDGSYTGWETRSGGEWSVLTPVGRVSYSGTRYNSGDISQTTNMITIGGPFANISYENDYMFGIGDKIHFVPSADGNDRYRTAAVRVQAGGLNLNLNMVTGEPVLLADGTKATFPDPDYNDRETYYENNYHRAGVLSIGIGPFRIGRNSENIRHQFQNKFAHDKLKKGESPYFKVNKNLSPSWFFYFGTGTGNSLW